jgi:hypothetical protein
MDIGEECGEKGGHAVDKTGFCRGEVLQPPIFKNIAKIDAE